MADVTQARIDAETINEPGDVITETIFITNVNGTQFDLTAFALSTTLYEDLFANTLSGYCVILDSADLVNIISFQGTEYITFSFRTPSFTERIAKQFKVTKVSDRAMTSNDREQTYTIHFTSCEAVLDNVLSLSKKYSGTTDAVITKIWGDHLTLPRFGGTTNPTQVVVANTNPHASSVSFVAASWSPFRTINWVCNRSFQTAGQAASFMWFESNKAFYFRNIEELISTQSDNKQIYARYTFSPVALNADIPLNKGTLYTKPNLPRQYGLARNMKAFTMFDILRGQDEGFYASKLVAYDVNLMAYQESFFDYYAPYAQEVTPNKNTEAFPIGIMRNAEATKSIRSKNYKLHNDSSDPLYEKWVLQRNSLLYEYSNVTLEIECQGRTDIEVGKLVEFILPKAIDKLAGGMDEHMLDPFMTSVYLITAIKHTFALNRHTMWLEITRII
jgi:hypothetical protein